PARRLRAAPVGGRRTASGTTSALLAGHHVMPAAAALNAAPESLRAFSPPGSGRVGVFPGAAWLSPDRGCCTPRTADGPAGPPAIATADSATDSDGVRQL